MRKYYTEQREKRKAKEKLSRSGPPSEKELVSSVRKEMQMREKFKTTYNTDDINITDGTINYNETN